MQEKRNCSVLGISRKLSRSRNSGKRERSMPEKKKCVVWGIGQDFSGSIFGGKACQRGRSAPCGVSARTFPAQSSEKKHAEKRNCSALGISRKISCSRSSEKSKKSMRQRKKLSLACTIRKSSGLRSFKNRKRSMQKMKKCSLWGISSLNPAETGK